MSIGLDPGSVLTVDDVIAITADVWACFLGEGDALVPMFGSAPPYAGAYTASVGITGTWNGHVILEIGEDAALRAARAMIGADDVAPADVADAVGELVNMVGGNLKGLVPAPSSLGLPLVFKGAGAPTSGRDVVSTCTADFDWLGQPVRISVWEWAQAEVKGEEET